MSQPICKKYTIVPALLLIVLCIGVGLALLWPCPHTETRTETLDPACVDAGLTQHICLKCEEIVGQEDIPALGHTFGDFAVKVLPIPNVNGIEARVCSVCDFEEEREYLCPHDNPTLRAILEPTCGEVGINEAVCPQCEYVQYLPIGKLPHAETESVVFQEPTCSVEGIEHLVCVECQNVTAENPIPLLECNWGEWILDVYATPHEAGTRHHVCVDCDRSVSEEYTVELGNNYLYIPSANILCDFAITGFTQSAVDNNDVIYTKRAYGVVDDTNPFVLGHWFGSLTTMWHTPVGAYVYICIDGRIDTYQVINSEYAVEMYSCYHLGQETGVNVFDAYGSAMNSQYAVYGRNHQGEDLWPEKNDGRTLHMYTCHNKSDRPGWKSSDGSRGRWIILANLVHSVNIETGEVLFEEEPVDLSVEVPVESITEEPAENTI